MMTIEELQKLLREKNIFGELEEISDKYITLQIDWGDWKHDHNYADYIMSEFGYYLIGKKITEEDGSDCYSALHYYTCSI